MINQKVIEAMVPNKADRVTYAAICEARQIEYADHLSSMTIPKTLKEWETALVNARVATVVGLFMMEQGEKDLTPEDVAELNKQKKEAANITIYANCVRPLIALLIGMWGEAPEHWPTSFDDALIERANKWTNEGKLFDGIAFANKVLAGA